jgi:predicted TIM-barrel fold metal-dependent hydrolase
MSAPPHAGLEPVLEPDLPIVDPHHHLWDRPNSRYMLPDLLADIETGGHKVRATVYVEALSFYSAIKPFPFNMVGETEFVAGVAAMAESGVYGPVRACAGIVSRADLTAGAAVEAQLEAHIAAAGGRFRGIRHAGAWDADPAVPKGHVDPPQGLYAQPAFREGLGRLAALGLSFEAWQYQSQLKEVIALARAVPQARIMLNHVGGPLGIGGYAERREAAFAQWEADVRELAQCPNVWVKLGGLGMAWVGQGFDRDPEGATSEALAKAWRPYIETCLEAFGPQRGVFESNFPVDKVSCSYRALWNAFKRIAAGASAAEKAALFHDNAIAFYRLELGD